MKGTKKGDDATVNSRLLLMQFFAEEGENEAPAAQGKKTSSNPEQGLDDVRFSDFDTKSPLMNGGSFDADEETAAPLGRDDLEKDESPAAETDKEQTPKDAAPEEGPERKQPFRVLKSGGREIPVASEEELERLAVDGAQMQSVRDALNPYLPFLQAMRADPQFAQSVSDMMARRTAGIPVKEPMPEEGKGTRDDPEPSQEENESYDAFEKRLAAWRERRREREIEKKIQTAFQQKEQREHTLRMRETQSKLVEYVNQDPRKEEILGAVFAPAFPAGLRQAMNQDPAAFMVIYDALCMLQGRPGHFGAPLPGAVAPRGTTTQTQQVRQEAVGESAGRTTLKGRAPAPFTERGGVGAGVKTTALPDYKNMPEDEFDKFVSQTKAGGF